MRVHAPGFIFWGCSASDAYAIHAKCTRPQVFILLTPSLFEEKEGSEENILRAVVAFSRNR